MNDILFKPIGIIHSPFSRQERMPIQSRGAINARGYIEIFPDFVEGIRDLSGFSHIFLLYHLHLSKEYQLMTTPFLDTEKRGVFATRSPRRPNPVGLSVVELLSVKGNRIDIAFPGIIDGTPLLDIKPYIPEFDCWDTSRNGWYEERKFDIKKTRSDKRFNI